MRNCKLIIVSILFTVLWCLAVFLYPNDVSAAQATDSNQWTLRIGISDEDTLFFDSIEHETGYLAEYMEHIAYYTKKYWGIELQIEYIRKSESELYKMLEHKEIDIIGFQVDNLYQYLLNQDIKSNFIHDIATLQYSMYTNINRTDILFENYSQFENMTVGILNDTNSKEIAEQYMNQNKFHSNLKTYPSKMSLQQALENNEIDAVISLSNNNTFSRVIGNLASIKLCLQMNEEDANEYSAFMGDLLSKIYLEEPEFVQKLEKKYFSDVDETFEALTQEELIYMQGVDSLRIAVCTTDKPNSYYNKRNDSMEGVYIELAKLLQKKSGIKFEYVKASSYDHCLQLVNEGKADIILGVYELSSIGESWNLNFTKPLLMKRIAVIGMGGNSFSESQVQTVAITASRSEEMIAYIREYFPNWNKRFYKSDEDSFKALASGKVNFILSDADRAQYSFIMDKYKDASVISSLVHEVSVTIGISKNLPKILQEILGKQVLSLTNSEIITCQINNYNAYSTDLQMIWRKYYLIIIIAIVLLIASILAGTAVISHKKVYIEQKSLFFANMSHEIRTPLNGIVGMTNVAKKNLYNPDRVKYCLDKIEFSTAHLLTIVNDILDLSKLEKNKMQAISENFDLKMLLCSVHAVYHSQALAKKIDFDTNVCGIQNEWFVGDPTKINQVLINLLSNALKFTPEGGRIRLSVKQQEAEGGCANLSFIVTDTGIGIARENLSKIFNAYEQQGVKFTSKYGGTGLGLSISKRLVEVMGGKLLVDSKLGEGSSFYFTLKLVARESQLVEESPDCYREKHALVVDDESESSKYIAEILTSLDIRADWVITGEEAVSKVTTAIRERDPYNYCLVDWRMPNMDGEATIRMLREVGNRDLRIIVCSAIDYSQIGDALKAVGADFYIEKPIFKSSIIHAFTQLSHNKEYNVPDDTKEPYFLTKRKVLIVEDNEINLEIAYELLKMTGATVETAVNGEEAIDKFKESNLNEYDFILMDIQMPKMNGYEATREIRSLTREDAKSVVIIAMTADAYAEDIKKALEAGMNYHIAKPIDLRILNEALKRFLPKGE